MASRSLLSVLVIGFIVGIAAARELINCLDGDTCAHIRAVVQGPQDVREVVKRFSRSKSVDLYGNLLTQFLDPNFAHQKLSVQWERLNISYNFLEDDFFTSIQSNQLKFVDITYNKLKTVTVMPSVIEFIAERNNLYSVNIQSKNLQRLILPKNEIDSLGSFNNLARLTELDLSCNKLGKLDVSALSSLTSLRVLKLANNGLHIIEGTASIRSLESLDLSNNILTTVDESINNFPNLKNLYLQGNKIVIWIINKVTIYGSLKFINIENNDWDCKHLGELKKKISGKIVPGSDASKCTTVDSPYADRLIKYRKQEFKALQEGIARQDGSISCDAYKPNPCDGDDNLVYEVAGSSVRTAEGLAKQSVQQLETALSQEENVARSIQAQIEVARRENTQLVSENNELANYIGEQYRLAGLSGDSDVEIQLNKIFEHYEYENTKRKEDINAEERRNQDKLNEINMLQTQMDDESYRKDTLLEDLEKRNTTVIGYENKIKELEKRLASG